MTSGTSTQKAITTRPKHKQVNYKKVSIEMQEQHSRNLFQLMFDLFIRRPQGSKNGGAYQILRENG
jgi:hypothetical protein